VVLPDDELGREHLFAFLILASMKQSADNYAYMLERIELRAPWMSKQEGQEMVAKVSQIPIEKRWERGIPLNMGKRIMLTVEEWRELRLKQITPVCDADGVVIDLEEARRQRRNERRRERRALRKVVRKAGEFISPITGKAVSRATFFRHWKQLQKQSHEQSHCGPSSSETKSGPSSAKGGFFSQSQNGPQTSSITEDRLTAATAASRSRPPSWGGGRGAPNESGCHGSSEERGRGEAYDWRRDAKLLRYLDRTPKGDPTRPQRKSISDDDGGFGVTRPLLGRSS